MKSYKKEGRSNFRILTLFLSKPAQKRLKKLMNIKGKKKIQLRDIFKRYGENVEAIVYVYGNDRVIGTRRVFESPRYTIYDIVDDDSYKFKKVNVSAFDNLETKQKKISSIHKNLLL